VRLRLRRLVTRAVTFSLATLKLDNQAEKLLKACPQAAAPEEVYMRKVRRVSGSSRRSGDYIGVRGRSGITVVR
jgi:hypothetical protein